MLETARPIDEPSASLAGPGAAGALRRALLATRPAFFVASAMPVLIGTAWAAATHHRFDAALFVLALACTVLAHAAANVFNDVGDDVIGADDGNVGRIYPYTGGSRFIQSGLLTRARMLRLAAVLAIAALLLGALLALLRGPGVVVLGLVGLALGVLYSLPALPLSAKGLGEAAVTVAFGPLPLLGCVWLQAQRIDAGSMWISVPVGLWTGAILLVNEVPDIEADRRAGKRTLVVRFGPVVARRLYQIMTATALIASLVALALNALPRWYLLPALGLALLGASAAQGVQTSDRAQLTRAIRLTLAIQALGGLALLAAIAWR